MIHQSVAIASAEGPAGSSEDSGPPQPARAKIVKGAAARTERIMPGPAEDGTHDARKLTRRDPFRVDVVHVDIGLARHHGEYG